MRVSLFGAASQRRIVNGQTPQLIDARRAGVPRASARRDSRRDDVARSPPGVAGMVWRTSNRLSSGDRSPASTGHEVESSSGALRLPGLRASTRYLRGGIDGWQAAGRRLSCQGGFLMNRLLATPVDPIAGAEGQARAVHGARRPVNAGGKIARGFPQRFQERRLFVS